MHYVINGTGDYDEDAVYQSDMVKVFQWYQLLNDKGLLVFTEEENKEEHSEDAAVEKPVIKKETKTATPKAAAKETVKSAAAPAAKSTKKPKKV